MIVDDDKCREFGLDPKKVESIARRLSKAAVEAHALGLKVFGGSGRGSLRYFRYGAGSGIGSEVAMLDGTFDGGDGGDE